MTESAVQDVHERMRREVAASGGLIEAVYHCPHEEGACDCRKPRPGMLTRAARELAIDLTEAVVVGDALSDVEAARAAGCASILIAETPPEPAVADAVVGSLWDAARLLTS